LRTNATEEDVALAAEAVLNLNANSVIVQRDLMTDGYNFEISFPSWKTYESLSVSDIELEGTNARVQIQDSLSQGPSLDLVVLNNGVDSSMTSAPFQYHNRFSVSFADPVIGSVIGGTVVEVRLTPDQGGESEDNFVLDFERDEVKCRFGLSVSDAIVAGNRSVYCVTNPHRSGTVVVSVSLNGQDFVSSDVAFTFQPVVKILSLYPSEGPVMGGTSVQVNGLGFPSDFLESSRVQCRFDNIVVDAVLSSSEGEEDQDVVVHCVSPSVTQNGNVRVEVTNNAQDFTSQSMFFRYQDPLFVTQVEPSVGPASGGSEVFVRGGVFANSSDLYCRFGDNVVDAMWLDESVVRCVTPNARPIHEVQKVSLRSRAERQIVVLRYFGTSVSTTSGYWILGSDVGTECTDIVLDANATETDIQNAVMCLNNLTSSTTSLYGKPVVTKQNEQSTITWTIEFPERRGYGELPALTIASRNDLRVNNLDVTELTTLRLVSGTRNEIQRVRTTSSISPVHGTFTLSTTNGTTTSPIAFNATASDMARALYSLHHEIGTVHVERDMLHPPSETFEWIVHFESVRGNVDPLIADGLLLGAGNDVTVTEHDGTSSPFDGSFSLKFQGLGTECLWSELCETSSNSINFDTSASELETKLQTFPSLSEVDVKRTVQQGEVSWTISFVPSTFVLDEDVRYGASEIPLFQLKDHTSLDYAFVSNATILLNSVSCDGDFTYNYAITDTMQSCKEICDHCAPCASFVHLTSIRECRFKGTSSYAPLSFGEGDVYLKYARNDNELVIQRERAGMFLTSGTVPVEISSNAQDFSSSGVLFEYLSITVVDSLSPSHGPLRGNTEVDIFGANFRNSSRTYCKFGDDARSVVPMSAFVSSTHIRCVSPGRIQEGPVEVMVSNDGYSSRSKWSQHGAHFTYDKIMPRFEVFPSQGPSLGGSEVRVMGNNFVNSTWGPVCRFGSSVVPAEFITSSELLCITPSYVLGYYPVEISNNNQDFTSHNFPYHFYENMVLERIEPVSGPAKVAGTSVHVYGRNFVNSSLLTCRFGPQLVPARFVSSSLILCRSPVSNFDLTWKDLSTQANRDPDPKHRNMSMGRIGWSGGSEKLFPYAHHYPLYLSKLVSLEISNNAQDYTASGIRYLYQKDAIVDSVFPNSGHDTGATPLFVSGHHFVNSTSLRCRVGQSVSDAQFVTSKLVICFAPPRSRMEFNHGVNRRRGPRRFNMSHLDAAITQLSWPHTVFVEISNNGIDFTSNWNTFEYLDPCPSGSFCPTHERSSQYLCPRGTFCSGTGNSNFTMCPRGTYQPKRGQAECLRCPIGYVCPEYARVLF
jgi:hypothetical protein